MKNRGNWLPRLAAGVLVVGVLAGMALAAPQQGSQGDPLVTMSYILEKVAPELLAQADQKLAAQQESLTGELNGLIDGYSREMEEQLAQYEGESAAFTLVDLPRGKTLIGSVGCEIMLRLGTGRCLAPNSPGLIDMTDGATLNNGEELLVNHLYMVTVADRGVTAATELTLLVRGAYTIR